MGVSANSIKPEVAPRIVFVDDDPEVLEEYAELLEMLGHSVTTFSSPNDALTRVLADECIKVVVTDFRMPALDGLGLIQALRARLPASRRVGFIILTGMGAGFQLEGADDIPRLTKPFDYSQLLELMQPYLK